MKEQWTTKEGQKLDIDKMEHRHILNCIKMMNRRYLDYFQPPSPNAIKDITQARKELKGVVIRLEQLNREMSYGGFDEDDYWIFDERF